MGAVRALQRRVVRLENAQRPRFSPIVRWFGSFDDFVTTEILPGIRSGALAERDILEITEALRTWETNGTWDRA